jgi:hypothetical protein
MPPPPLLNAIFNEYERSREIDVGLVRQAWEDPESREAIIEALLESLEKLGGFEKVPFWMEALPASLSCDRVVDLYNELRSRSVRNELEWRIAFQASFTRCRGDLPAIEDRSIRSSDCEMDLLTAAEKNDVESAAMLIECMLRIGFDPRTVRIALFEDLGISEDEMDRMSGQELGALIRRVARDKGTLVRDYAIELGHHQIVALFDAIPQYPVMSDIPLAIGENPRPIVRAPGRRRERRADTGPWKGIPDQTLRLSSSTDDSITQSRDKCCGGEPGSEPHAPGNSFEKM